jgi:hypothetical protein
MEPVSAELLALNEELTSLKLAPIWNSRIESRQSIGANFKLFKTLVRN